LTADHIFMLTAQQPMLEPVQEAFASFILVDIMWVTTCHILGASDFNEDVIAASSSELGVPRRGIS